MLQPFFIYKILLIKIKQTKQISLFIETQIKLKRRESINIKSSRGKRFISLFLALIVLLTSVQIPQVQAKNQGNKGNKASKEKIEETYVGDGYEVNFKVTSQWNDGFNGNVTITNTSDTVIDNWLIGFELPHEITNIWNGVISYKDDDFYIIKNAGHNQDINVNQSVNFGFTASYVGEWAQNIVGVGINNYHAEERAAKKYAKKIANKYSNCNIYITGHSLGGYLAQIGAAEMISETSVKPEKVAYFNGIGLKYNKILFWTKNNTMDTLKEYSKTNDLISYEIKGDVVSEIGEHSGDRISFYAADEPRAHHTGRHGKGILKDFLSKSATGWLCLITGDNLVQYYEYYDPQSVVEYFWITHETDSFYYHLSQGMRNESAVPKKELKQQITFKKGGN